MDIQQRIAEVLGRHQKGFFGGQYGNCAACTCDWKGAGWADHAAEAVASELGFTQLYIVDYGDGELSETSWEHWDEARDHAAEGPGDDLGDSKILTGWFTGWEGAEAPVGT